MHLFFSDPGLIRGLVGAFSMLMYRHTWVSNSSYSRKMKRCYNRRIDTRYESSSRDCFANFSFSHFPRRLQACSRMQLLVVRVNCHHLQPLPCGSNLSISFRTSASVKALPVPPIKLLHNAGLYASAFHRVFSSKKTAYLLCELSESGTIFSAVRFFNMEIDIF